MGGFMYIRRRNIQPAGFRGNQCQQPDAEWVLNNLVMPVFVTVLSTFILNELLKSKRR
jgi:hypothetical protein